MRRMRACSTANAVFIGFVLAGLAFAACSSGPTPTPTPPGPNAVPHSSAAPAGSAATPPAATASGAQGASSSGAPRGDLTNDPDGGVALNNAQTSADAGKSDRLQPLIDIIKGNRDGFRRCFDMWGKSHPGESGTTYLVLSIKPDGKLAKAEIDASKGSLHAIEVEQCIVELAKTLNYPKSPSGKETRFTYPFDFKAK
jgi:hypothetical protein